MIELKNVTKLFGDKVILKDVNLTIEDGAFFGLVGINGAGKSTLLRILSGVLKPDGGEVLFDNEPVYDNEKAKKGIFFLPDNPYFTLNITAAELAEMYKVFYDFDSEKFDFYLQKFKLNKKASLFKFSKGMRRQVFVSLALSCRPKYLFLDEAYDGLDPLARMILKKGIVELTEECQTTVIISSHSLKELQDICTSYGLIDKQTISSSGKLDEQLQKYQKYQVAISGDVSEQDLGFECRFFEKSGLVIKFITNADKGEVEEKLKKFNPLFVENLELDFEELFACEVESKGYLQ